MYQLTSISNRLFRVLSLLFLLSIMSCGSEDPEEENQMNLDCSGDASFMLDGQNFNFENPSIAEFVFNESLDMHEFLLSWNGSDGGLGFQIIADLDGAECFGDNQSIDLNNLPIEIATMTLQFNNLQYSVNASTIQDNVTGVIVFDSCNEDKNTLSFSFEFSAGDFFGNNSKEITEGKVSNVCYAFN